MIIVISQQKKKTEKKKNMTFNYNSAIVRGVPNSFANALRMEEPENAINVSKVRP